MHQGQDFLALMPLSSNVSRNQMMKFKFAGYPVSTGDKDGGAVAGTITLRGVEFEKDVEKEVEDVLLAQKLRGLPYFEEIMAPKAEKPAPKAEKPAPKAEKPAPKAE